MDNIPSKIKATMLEHIEQNIGFYTATGNLKDTVKIGAQGEYKTGFWNRLLAKGNAFVSRIIYSKAQKEEKLNNIMFKNFADLILDVDRANRFEKLKTLAFSTQETTVLQPKLLGQKIQKFVNRDLFSHIKKIERYDLLLENVNNLQSINYLNELQDIIDEKVSRPDWENLKIQFGKDMNRCSSFTIKKGEDPSTLFSTSNRSLFSHLEEKDQSDTKMRGIATSVSDAIITETGINLQQMQVLSSLLNQNTYAKFAEEIFTTFQNNENLDRIIRQATELGHTITLEDKGQTIAIEQTIGFKITNMDGNIYKYIQATLITEIAKQDLISCKLENSQAKVDYKLFSSENRPIDKAASAA